MFEKFFKRSEAVTKLIEALRKDPSRIKQNKWERLFSAVREEANYSDKKWMDAQRKLIVSEELLTRISVADLTDGESEEPKASSYPSGYFQAGLASQIAQQQTQLRYQEAQMRAHAAMQNSVAQHGFNGYQNSLGDINGNP